MYELLIITTDKTLSRHLLTGEKTTLGRGDDNTIPIRDHTVSTHHAELVQAGGALLLRDVGSRNGIVFQNERVQEVPIAGDCAVALGTANLVFREIVAAESERALQRQLAELQQAHEAAVAQAASFQERIAAAEERQKQSEALGASVRAEVAQLQAERDTARQDREILQRRQAEVGNFLEVRDRELAEILAAKADLERQLGELPMLQAE